MRQYIIDWRKTKENINFHLLGKSNKANLGEALCVGERAAQKKLEENTKELSVRDLLVLADYVGCDIKDLLVLSDDVYVAPDYEFITGMGKRDVEDATSQEVIEALDIIKQIKDSYEIRNLQEFLLYLPLIKEINLRDSVFRCYGNLTYDCTNYVMSQMSYLYNSIPDCEAKCEADRYRDNVLRVKGAPGNNLFGVGEKEFNKEYWKSIRRYYKEENIKCN